MGVELKSVDRSYCANLMFCIVLFVVLILSHTGFAFELLTFKSTTAKYTYYLNAAGEQVKHGTDTRYYTYPTVSQIIHWSHGQQHGLDEAWYKPHYSYGYVKHWEKNYQNGVLHGSSKQWTQSTGQIESFTNYRYGVLDGVYQKWRSAPDFSQYNPYYFHMHENANYKNGLLHGAYTKWITKTYTSYGYTYYNQRIKDQEGYYAYGKKDGKWKFYHSTESSPYYVKSEGYYSNDNKCGDWRYYYATTGGLASTEYLGKCGATYPPGGGGDLPGGGQYEIRGHVYGEETNLPLSNAYVQAGTGDSTTNDEGFYSIALDSGADTLNCVLEGYYNYSRQVDMTDAQFLNIDIYLKQKDPGGKPGITNVDSAMGEFFIESLSANNDYNVSVDWADDAPGIVKFEANGTEYEANADQDGATYTFDMGSDFSGSLSPTGNTLKITAVNDSGVASDPKTIYPVVIPLPDWSLNFGNGFEIKTEKNNLVYKLDLNWPEKPIEVVIDENELGSVLWQAWGLFPYIGGRVFGIKETQAFVEIEAKTDGSGSIAAGGKSGFDAAGGTIEIKLGGKGNLKYENNKGLEWRETSLIVGLKGTIKKEVGPVTIIPALEGAVNLPLIGGAVGWFNDRAKIKGSITTGSEMALEIMSATGEIGFNKADIQTDAGIGLGMSIDIIEDLEAEVTGGGNGKISWQVPADPDYFKQLDAALTANIQFTIMGWAWKIGYTHPYTYPATTRQSLSYTQSIPTYTLKPVSRDFLDYGDYNKKVAFSSRLTQDIGGTGAKTNFQVVENVFPHSDPAIAEYEGNAAIAYVYLDPDNAANQDTEIYYSFFDGSDYTDPAPILDDTRADFSPSIAYDSTGKIICVWQRVKNENFTGESILDMVPEIEIVYSVYDPGVVTPAWSEPQALTDNVYMDYNPMLRRGSNGNLMLVWFSNEGNQLIGNTANPTAAHYAAWNGSGFSSVSTVVNALADCFKFSFAYNGIQGILTYTKDMDGTFIAPEGSAEPASNDQEIFFIEFDGTNWGSPTRVTADDPADTADTNPQVLYNTVGNPELVWLRGDTIVHLKNWASPYAYETIKTDILSAGLMDFKFYSDPNDHLVILWQESDDKGIDLFYSVYDNNNSLWSNDLRLTDDPEMEKDFDGLFDGNNTLHLVFNKKEADTGATGLFHMTYELTVDLMMPPDSISMDQISPLPGDAVTLTATVLNNGDLSIIDESISFYMGDPAGSGVLIGSSSINITPASLKAGETGQASIDWTIPADITEYTVYAVSDPDNTTVESSEDNNKAQFEIIRPDLEAVHCGIDQKPDGTYHIVADIKNNGSIDAHDVEVLFKAQEDIIDTMIIPDILPGLTAQVSLPAALEFYNYSSWTPEISFVVDPENKISEISEENNTASTIYTLNILDPASYDFGKISYKGLVKNIIVFNKTQVPMSLGDIALSGQDVNDFTIIDAPCKDQTLPAQTSCIIAVQCLPSTLGVKNAELIINNDQGRLLGSVSLTGELDHLIPGDVNDSNLPPDLVDAMTALSVATGVSESELYLITDTNKDGRISIHEVIFVLQNNSGGARP